MDVPETIKDLIRKEAYRLTKKANEGLTESGFDLGDLEHAILNGAVVDTRKDHAGGSRMVYVMVGPARSGHDLYSQGRIIHRDRREFLGITAHKPRR